MNSVRMRNLEASAGAIRPDSAEKRADDATGRAERQRARLARRLRLERRTV